MRDAILKKKEAFRELRKTPTDESKSRYRKLRNLARKVVAKTMKTEAEKELIKMHENPNHIFRIVKRLKKDGKDLEGGRCIKDKAGRLGFSEIDRRKIWKDHMENIMNQENDWDHITTANLVEGPIEKVSKEEIIIALKMMKQGKAPGPSEVNTEMVIASGETESEVMKELC